MVVLLLTRGSFLLPAIVVFGHKLTKAGAFPIFDTVLDSRLPSRNKSLILDLSRF